MSKKIVSSVFAYFKQVYNSFELFRIEFGLLKFFGHYPMNMRRIVFGLFADLCLSQIPNVVCLTKSIIDRKSKLISLSAMECLLNIFSFMSIICFTYNYKHLKKFLDELNFTWKIEEGNEKWEEIKKKRTRFCNRLSFWGQFLMHINGLVYFFVPSFVFLYKRYFTSTSETYSVFMVE